jgi:hypothetical protein
MNRRQVQTQFAPQYPESAPLQSAAMPGDAILPRMRYSAFGEPVATLQEIEAKNAKYFPFPENEPNAHLSIHVSTGDVNFEPLPEYACNELPQKVPI